MLILFGQQVHKGWHSRAASSRASSAPASCAGHSSRGALQGLHAKIHEGLSRVGLG